MNQWKFFFDMDQYKTTRGAINFLLPEDRGYKSISSITTQSTTFDESFTPKSKYFNKTVFKKAF